MGAATALVLAGTYPDLPRMVLLEDPPPWWAESREGAPGSEERQAGMRAWISELKDKTREELIAQQRAKTPHWSEAELGPWADSKLRLSPHVLNRGDAAPVDWPTILRRITCPALLITADPARGGMITEESARELQAMVPQLRLAHVPEAGHSIRRDQFDRYMEVVHAFLDEWVATTAS
jgi:pimeloyl-ACP methyl ester carboxylesterase